MKHGNVNQRNIKGKLCSLIMLILQTLLWKRIFRVFDPKMTSNDPKMTLEWPKINPVHPKCAFVLCGMIFSISVSNMKTVGLPEQQIYRLCNCLPESIGEFQLFQVFSWLLVPKKLKIGGLYSNLKYIGSFPISFTIICGYDEAWYCQSKKWKRRNWFTDTVNYIAETDILSFWPQMTLRMTYN